MKLAHWLPIVATGFSLGCERVIANIDFERMIEQDKLLPYETTHFFPDGRTMQLPPEGTVPRDRIVGQPALTRGVVDGHVVELFPVEVDADLLQRGRDRYDVYCAPCHGILGDGSTSVAENMRLRKPPSLHDPQVRGAPPGEVFQVITHGYGLMPSYASELPVRDRWAVIAYVEALQYSQNARLQDLPVELQDEARGELP
jgi:hypothetical protein